MCCLLMGGLGFEHPAYDSGVRCFALKSEDPRFRVQSMRIFRLRVCVCAGVCVCVCAGVCVCACVCFEYNYRVGCWVVGVCLNPTSLCTETRKLGSAQTVLNASAALKSTTVAD